MQGVLPRLYETSIHDKSRILDSSAMSKELPGASARESKRSWRSHAESVGWPVPVPQGADPRKDGEASSG